MESISVSMQKNPYAKKEKRLEIAKKRCYNYAKAHNKHTEGVMNIKKHVRYIGVNDKNIDLFEGQYVVPNGMAYNSYVILDEKIAVFDTVDAAF